MNRKLLVIGCGGVAAVAIQKCCQNSEMFPELVLASRTVEKCDALVESLKGKTATVLSTAKVDADSIDEVVALIRRVQPYAVLNVALPYQDLTIMEACLACGVHYVDTANFEPENTEDPAWRKVYDKRVEEEGFSALFDYSWQWAYAEKFEKAGLTALLGTGFDPGVTSVYVSYAKKHYFDRIDTVDILDCNGGDHGYAFATNFNPEINLREVSAPGSYWENGKWVEIPAMSIKADRSHGAGDSRSRPSPARLDLRRSSGGTTFHVARAIHQAILRRADPLPASERAGLGFRGSRV